jgi:hypothetical protein
MPLVTQLEVLADLAAAASGVAFAVALLLTSNARRRPVPARLTLLVVVTGLGFGCRAIDAWAGAAWAHHAQYLGFGLFPIAALLFAEAATDWSAPLPLKVAVLAGTVLFSVTWPASWVDHRPWRLAMMALQLIVVVAVTLRFAMTRRRSTPGPRRSTLTVMTVLASGAAVGVVSENRELLGVWLPRTGALGLLLVAYAAACSFHAGGLWRVSTMAARLAGIVLAASALALSVRVVERTAPIAALVWTAALPPFAFLAFEPARLLLCRDPNRRAGALLARLASVRTGDAPATLDALRAWPELRGIDVAATADLRAVGYEQLGPYLAANPRALDRSLLDAARADADGWQARPFEEIADLLDRRDADLIAPLGPDRVLLVAVDGFIDPGAVRLVLDPIVQLVRHEDERPSAWGSAA